MWDSALEHGGAGVPGAGGGGGRRRAAADGLAKLRRPRVALRSGCCERALKRVGCPVEQASAATVLLVVRLGRDAVEQLFESVDIGGQDCQFVGDRCAPHHSFKSVVQQLDGLQRLHDLCEKRDLELAGGSICADDSREVERRTFPAADHTGVVASCALPLDRRWNLAAENDDAAEAWATCRSARAADHGEPCDARVGGSRRAHDATELLSDPTRRRRCVTVDVEEVAEIGDEHQPRKVLRCERTGTELGLSSGA